MAGVDWSATCWSWPDGCKRSGTTLTWWFPQERSLGNWGWNGDSPSAQHPKRQPSQREGTLGTGHKGRTADLIWIRDRRDLKWSGHLARALGAALVMQQAMQIPRPKNMPWHWLRYRRVDAWVAGLDWLKAECIAKTPMSERRCHVLPLPLDERWFTTEASEKSVARRSLGLKLPEDVFLMGTVGRLDVGKGQRDALRALALLPQQFHWLFVGDNTNNNGADEQQQLLVLARALGVQNRAHFLPGQADVLPVYDALDVFVMTSKSETIGTVTLEAMARSVPVVGTDAGGTAEILAENRGILFAPGDATALSRAVQQLHSTPSNQRSSATEAGYNYVSPVAQTALFQRGMN